MNNDKQWPITPASGGTDRYGIPRALRVVPGDQFDRIKALLTSDEFDIRETYTAQSAALAAAGWDDPELDIYNDYDAIANEVSVAMSCRRPNSA